MDDSRHNEFLCQACGKSFLSKYSKNRHLKAFHPEVELEPVTKKRIICPLCRNEDFSSYKNLVLHLTEHHELKIIQSVLKFPNFEKFAEWRALENREVDFVCHKTSKANDGSKYILYVCNRSDTKGFSSTCKTRKMKSGGSIKINGVCPSRIETRVLKNGEVQVNFTETHVGHEDELRSKRLSRNEEKNVVEQLMAGVSTSRILQDARKIEDNEISRRNLITDADLNYLRRKFNVDNQRHEDDMIATSLKVEEWNQQGKNYGFLFKKIGDSYPGLNNEDFALGFMNGVMEKKLIENSKTICIDGTHGTNRKNWDLTIVLIKDDMNKGFPVAFLLSNRLDQKIQEIFLTALQARLGKSIEAEFIMSDDDPKYYNAWVKVMDPQKKSRRLLCTWHIIKNWNIQGRTKIKDENIRKGMKMAMRQILQEMDPSKFEELKHDYLKFLEDNGEIDFLKYLKTYYFQTIERIMMWAHCYRKNAGINTNMAIESLNKYLKHNKMDGKQNLRVERLLDILEEIVDEKMWKKIIEHERPSANSYQHRMTVDFHKMAERSAGEVVEMKDGTYQVKATSERDKYYIIYSNELCDADCRTGYCNECQICLHRYRCSCSSNSVKTVLCKHIHAVVMFRLRSDSVLGAVCVERDDNLHISEPSLSQAEYQNDVEHFIGETSKTKDLTKLPDSREKEIRIAQLNHYAKLLDMEQLDQVILYTKKMADNKNEPSKKRKIETQTYYPSKR